MKSKGMDDLSKRLGKMADKAKEMDGKNHNFSTDELFHDGFMKKYTNFETFDKFLEDSPADAKSQEEFDTLQNDDAFNNFVNEQTTFESWTDMVQKAGFEQISKQIFE